MAIVQNIQIFRGEDVVLGVTLTPITNITGWTLNFYLRKKPEVDSLVLLSVSGSVTDGPNGVFTISLSSASTLVIPVDKYHYDIWRTDAGENVVLCYGTFIVNPQSRYGPP